MGVRCSCRGKVQKSEKISKDFKFQKTSKFKRVRKIARTLRVLSLTRGPDTADYIRERAFLSFDAMGVPNTSCSFHRRFVIHLRNGSGYHKNEPYLQFDQRGRAFCHQHNSKSSGFICDYGACCHHVHACSYVWCNFHNCPGLREHWKPGANAPTW